MPRLVLLVGSVLLALAIAPAAAFAAVTVSLVGDQVVLVDDGPDLNDITVTATSGAYTVTEAGPGLALIPGAGCTGGTTEGNPVTCARSAPTTEGIKADVTMADGSGTSPQVVEIGSGVGTTYFIGGNGRDEFTGGDGNDYAEGRDGGDQLDGGAGDDALLGGAGPDGLNGWDGSDTLKGGLGADSLADTGTTGIDTASYQEPERTTGVDVTLDGVANDGSTEDGGLDSVTSEFETVTGTNFADVLEGDNGPDALVGAEGGDVLIGNHGSDAMFGGGGTDTLNADDGEADGALDCNDAGTRGTSPNTAVIDRGLDDAAVVDCSTILPEAGDGGGGGGGGDDGGGTGTGTGTGSGTATTTQPTTHLAPRPTFFTLAATGGTQTVSRMPKVVGVKAAVARERILKAIPNADIDIDFDRTCRDSQDTEIIKQSPLRGAAVTNHVRDAAAVSLVMCLAERDFLRDCDLKDLRDDLRLLRGKADAEFTSTILGGVNKCKVDYDVRMAKKAKEAEIALAAQKLTQRSKKGQIRAAIDCPTSPSQTDLRVFAKEDYVVGRLNTSFGLRASGPDGWTLPAGFRSFVTLEGIDRAFQFLGNPTTYIDADDVTSEGNTMRRQAITWSKGRARFNLTPEKAGTIRICTILESGGDEVLTHALSIRVVPRPKNGTRWETVGGRVIEVTEDGGKWLTTAQASGTARAAFLDKVWGFVVGLFDGRSRTVNEQASESRPLRQKVEAIYTQAKLGTAQLALDGRLDGDPQPPVVVDGPCFITSPDGKLTLGRCKVLQPAGGNSALFGTSYAATPIVAAGAGNIVAAGAGNIVAAGAGNLIGPDGGSLIGADGGSLIGPDGASLVGPDGASIVAAGAGNIVAAGAGNIVAAGGGNAISIAPAQIVAAGAGNMVAAGAGNIVAAGGLN